VPAVYGSRPRRDRDRAQAHARRSKAPCELKTKPPGVTSEVRAPATCPSPASPRRYAWPLDVPLDPGSTQ